MARRKQSSRVRYEMSVAFKEGQDNLPEALTRLTEKVDRKKDSSDLEQVLIVTQDASAQKIIEIQDQITELQQADSVMPTDQITSIGATTYAVSFNMTSDSEANYDVSVNGLVQDPLSDYSINISNNSVSFANPPPAGDDIVITQRDTSTFDAEEAINDFLSALHN